MREFFDLLREHWVLETILAAGLALYKWARKNQRLIFRIRHVRLACVFRFKCFLHRSGLRFVTLDDYVALLERLRGELLTHFAKEPHTHFKIHVFTMQLPRDWPLWASEVTAESPDKTALEQYFFNFHRFLKDFESSEARLDLRRTIIIENSESPAGLERFEQLRADAQQGYFERYMKMLHTADAEARYYLHKRPWPGWLTDAVFYGIRSRNGSTVWLWGVTTSYNAGEDLILLRLHRMRSKELASRFSLPWGAHSLVQLLDSMDGVEKDEKMPELRTLSVRPTPPVPQPAVAHTKSRTSRANDAHKS